jgi:benzoyl-CoA reductase subunit B
MTQAAGSVQKDRSMTLQKEMLARYYSALGRAEDEGVPTAYTFVPGNLTELIRSFDVLPVLPEINALQNAMRKQSRDHIGTAEKLGHSEDVCTYVKCDIGMSRAGNIGPTGEKVPRPSLLLLSYTGCFTFMKWFELLQKEYDCPIVMLHVPYQGGGEATPAMRDYVVRQLEEKVIPALEQASGRSLDMDRLSSMLELSRQAEDRFVEVLNAARHVPSPIDAYFGGVYYISPIFTAFRGSPEAVDYYDALLEEVRARTAAGEGPMTPEGPIGKERFRVVVEGPPCWTGFRDLWKMFSDEGAVVVASTYTKVGGVYDSGFRHDPARPLESLAEYCLGCYTNLNLPARAEMIAQYVREFQADGFLINSVKSCNSFSAGQLLILRQVEALCGRPGGFIESDLVDPRYFSAANVKNRLESYFQMLAQKRERAVGSHS